MTKTVIEQLLEDQRNKKATLININRLLESHHYGRTMSIQFHNRGSQDGYASVTYESHPETYDTIYKALQKHSQDTLKECNDIDDKVAAITTLLGG